MEYRQLRPIYDALEGSDPQRALKECDKLLRKHPNHPSARAIKAYVLTQTGRTEEALALSLSVLETPTAMASAHAQQGLTLAFRALGRPHEEIMVYTAALAHTPNDETLHCKVFKAAARNRMFKEQHQAAVQLNKLFDNPKYIWWLVVSLLLQARDSPKNAAAQVQLKLAERLVEKAVADGNLKSVEELRVYLDVLDVQDKREQMVEVMDVNGQLAALIANDPDLVTQRIELLIKTQAYGKAVEAAIAALKARDNWADYKLYIEAVIASVDPAAAGASVSTICAHLEAWAADRDRARSAKLAQVALATRMFESGFGDAAGLPELLIWGFIDQFQEKAICYTDIMQFIIAHHKAAGKYDAQAAVIDYHWAQLEKRMPAARESAGQSDGEAQAWVNLEKVRYLMQALRGETDPSVWLADIEVLLNFGLTSKPARKKQPACSDMTLLACQRIIQAAFLAHGATSARAQLHSALFKALCVLESGIRLNEGNFMLKLYAIRLYLYLSCYERARAIYDSLSIKHVQQETLGHMILGHGMMLGCFAADMELCYDGVAFYDRFRSKMPRDIESVYDQETYSNIQDFIEFQRNLDCSVQHECTHRYALRGEGFEYGSAKEMVARWEEADTRSIEHTEESLGALHDNRDISVMGLLTPKDLAQWDLELLTRPVPMPGHEWIQAFSLVPQIMHHMVCAEIELLQIKSSELAAIVDKHDNALPRSDLILIRGIIDMVALYIQATDQQHAVDVQLDKLVEGISANLPEDQFDSLFVLSSDRIRNLSAASELFTYALVLKHALSAQHLPAANAVGLALSQQRKSALKSVNALRGWTDKCARSLISDQWLADGDDAFTGVARFVRDSQKQTVLAVTKACSTSWLRSVKNVLMQWEQCSS
ncbi:mitochondrial distribution and morphology [Coemansia sp. RSA 2706]|nr:mitochondrial distribution and morphology [Coemansia sp. RSA 2706]